MTHRADVLLPDSEDFELELGEFDSATQARTACARHEGEGLAWSQPEDDVWEAQGRERWYRVEISRMSL